MMRAPVGLMRLARDQVAIGERLGSAIDRHLVHARRGDQLALRLRLPLTEHRHQPPFGNLEPKAILIFGGDPARSEEHTSELQSLMRISYAVFCLKKKKR